ncbi:hypothetical protein INT45_006178 [Circinella minor]|uniref:Uncharacterized protein n=1 Tax=Circinella minor TaxID=1195481 RepID=A0A8H7RV86_9FUNG|nr:hypothetical protein INT45_006178 [Circinella minor]
MATEHTLIIEATESFLLEVQKNRGEQSANLQEIIDHLENYIVSSSTATDIHLTKRIYTRLIKTVADSLQMSIVGENISWKRIERRLGSNGNNIATSSEGLVESSNPATSVVEDVPLSSSSSSMASSSTSLPSLKTKITPEDRSLLTNKFQNFKKNHQNDFWVLEATMKQTEDGTEPISVEEKVMEFALRCEYYHPSQSLILDLGDKNWSSVFSEEELDELRGAGDNLPCSIPEELEQCFAGLNKLKTGADVFRYARMLEIDDPSNELLKVWLSTELQKIAKLFLKTGTFDIDNLMESDQLYRCFDFLATIFEGSDIIAKGTEKSSEANATAVNQNRQLSSIKAISNRKMGRRGDIIFSSGHTELGCTEIGAANNQTKEIRDSLLKMPLVLRDMLLLATFSPNLLHQSHVIGYSISGGCVSLLDVSIPKGFITVIRRTEPLDFPNKNKNLVSRLCPLLNLACIGKTMMEQTLTLIDNTMRPISLSNGRNHWCLLPNFVPSQAKSQKRQRTD